MDYDTSTDNLTFTSDNSHSKATTENSAPKQPGRIWKIIGILSVIGVCAFAIICVFSIGTGIFEVVTQRDDIIATVDKFMKAMAKEDFDTAYGLFSTRAKKQFPVSDIKDMTTGSNLALFDGYESIEIQNLHLNTSFNTNTDLPQGKVATIDGVVEYEVGYQGTFDAILEREDGEWLLHKMNVNIPPAKLEDFIQKNSQALLR
ncbi:MAG: hypothetical protein R3264_05080 [Anaerolineae bacterium]|nr:hypothetical protein [Anaerolineae bacterium]